jgi:hypothetical protein
MALPLMLTIPAETQTLPPGRSGFGQTFSSRTGKSSGLVKYFN